jgi:hypothetical protein
MLTSIDKGIPEMWMVSPGGRFGIYSDQSPTKMVGWVSGGRGSFSRLSRVIHVSAAFSVAKPRSVLRTPLSPTTATLKPTPPSAGRTVYFDMLTA